MPRVIYITPNGRLTTNLRQARIVTEFEAKKVSLAQPLPPSRKEEPQMPPPSAPAAPQPLHA